MDIRIREMTPQEQKYSYTQSSQIMGQTGCIGHLRGFFDGDGQDFQHTWPCSKFSVNEETAVAPKIPGARGRNPLVIPAEAATAKRRGLGRAVGKC